ncbi:hypothetical protein [Candidatus Nitrosocosmicus sp. R]
MPNELSIMFTKHHRNWSNDILEKIIKISGVKSLQQPVLFKKYHQIPALDASNS